jgi:hypothetical protein
MTEEIYDLRGCTSQNIPNASPNMRMMASGSVHGDTSITKLRTKALAENKTDFPSSFRGKE